MYVHVFTNYSHPQELVNILKNSVQKNNITFGFENTTKESHVLNDFFSMAQFNILIRADSNFLLCAQIIGKTMVSISPISYHFKDRKLVIDESIAITRTKSNQVNKFKLPQEKEAFKAWITQAKL